MDEEDSKKAETEPGLSSVVKPPEDHDHASVKEDNPALHNDVDQKKVLNPPAQPKVADAATEKNSGDWINRDAVLARVETEKRLALIKAWEENEKAKADNRAYKRLSAMASWESSKKALVEAELKKYEEKLERKKAEYAERMKNKMAEIHRAAEEKRAMIEARRGEDVLKVEETTSKFRAAGYAPGKFLGCFPGFG